MSTEVVVEPTVIFTVPGVDKGKCGYLGWISGCLGALMGAPRVKGG